MLRVCAILAAGGLLAACSAKTAVQQFAMNIRDQSSGAYRLQAAAGNPDRLPRPEGFEPPRAPGSAAPGAGQRTPGPADAALSGGAAGGAAGGPGTLSGATPPAGAPAPN